MEGKNSFAGKDILGDFFEGIIRDGFKQSKGQFFTHTNIVCFLLWAMKLDEMAINSINKEQKIPYFIDPSSGSGTFLIEYMKFITENTKRRFKEKIDSTRDIEDRMQSWFYPESRENKWAERFIYGVEHNFNLGTSVKVNMILHGDGSSNIFVKDGLLPFEKYKKASEPNVLNKYNIDKSYKKKEVNSEFDIIITNPPFSVSLDKDTKEMLGKSFLFHEKKNSENLFIERYYQLLRENGRLGVVLPESVFDTTENKYIRLFIFKYFKVKAVVSLPQETFAPFTQTKTSLLFAQKKTVKEMMEWEELWSKASNKYSLLQTRAEKELELLETGKMNKKWAIASETEEIREENILILLQNLLEEDEKSLPLNEIIEKYKEEIKELCKIDKDITDVFGFVNTAWVFGEVSKQINYSIFMAEAESIGYKRTKRGEKLQKNDLFREIKDENGRRKVLLSEEDGIYDTILDQMRKINWD